MGGDGAGLDQRDADFLGDHFLAQRFGEQGDAAFRGVVDALAETLRKEMIAKKIRVTLIEPGAIATHLQPYDDARLAEFEKGLEMLPAGEVAEAILFAATRPPGVDVVTLRIEPLNQKIY